jgi:DNA mismatch endonuclease (patch repair protein)
MADIFTKKQRSEIMSRIKGKDTKPERLVRSLLHRMGFRFRLHVAGLPGKPDIVLVRHRKVVFVNGCFWHGHGACRKRNMPKTNKTFWIQKISKNKKRDELARRQLRKQGWRILTIWECETRDVEKAVFRLCLFMKP